MDELDVLDPMGEKVIIGGQTFIVKPLVFRQYRRLMKHLGDVLDAVSADLPDAGSSDTGKIIGALFDAGEPVLAMLAEILGTTAEFLDEHLTLESFSAVVLAVFRQNRLDRVIGNFQRLAPLLKARP